MVTGARLKQFRTWVGMDECMVMTLATSSKHKVYNNVHTYAGKMGNEMT